MDFKEVANQKLEAVKNYNYGEKAGEVKTALADKIGSLFAKKEEIEE